MKVLDLCCRNHHPFEGWFASEEDYRSQLERSLLECPMCGDKDIVRLPSAPRLSRISRSGGNVDPSEPRASRRDALRDQPPSTSASSPATSVSTLAAPSVGGDSSLDPAGALKTIWMHAVQQVLARTDDVGDRFAEEARRMHYGEAKERAIRGKATAEDAEALREEGIDVMSLRLPSLAKDGLQ